MLFFYLIYVVFCIFSHKPDVVWVQEPCWFTAALSHSVSLWACVEEMHESHCDCFPAPLPKGRDGVMLQEKSMYNSQGMMKGKLYNDVNV